MDSDGRGTNLVPLDGGVDLVEDTEELGLELAAGGGGGLGGAGAREAAAAEAPVEGPRDVGRQRLRLPALPRLKPGRDSNWFPLLSFGIGFWLYSESV